MAPLPARSEPKSPVVWFRVDRRSTHFFLRDSFDVAVQDATPVLEAVEGLRQIRRLRRVQHFDKCQAAVLARLLVRGTVTRNTSGFTGLPSSFADRVDEILHVVVAHP